MKFALGRYSWQTKCLIAASVVSVGVSFVPRSVNAVMMSRPPPWNVFLHASFPFPGELPVFSAPRRARNPGKAAVLLGSLFCKGIRKASGNTGKFFECFVLMCTRRIRKIVMSIW